MSIPYTPAASAALGNAYTGVRLDDPGSTAVIHDYTIVSACHVLYPMQNEILALIKGQTAGSQYQKTYTCVSGLTVGTPVYLSAADTVTAASSTSDTTAAVIGICFYKPTTTTCYISHFYQKTSAGSFTAGQSLYLDTSGAVTATPTSCLVGLAVNTTDAIYFGSPIAASVARAVSKFYVQTAAGTALTASTSETRLGIATIPANRLGLGNVLRCKYQGIISNATGATTLTVRLRLGPTTLTGTQLISGTATTSVASGIFSGQFEFVPRAAAGATAACVGFGKYHEPVAAGAVTEKVVALASTNFATNGQLLLEVTGQWSANDANSCRLDVFNVDIV